MSSYESSPSLSLPDLPSHKRYQGTSELVEEDKEDDDEEDEEIEESLDSDSVSEDAEDEGPTSEDEDPAAGSRVLVCGRQGVPLLWELRVVVGHGSGSTPEPERPERVSASRQPTLTTWTDLQDASLATAETGGFLTELGAQVEMSGTVRDEIFSQRYQFRSQTDTQRAALWHAISDTQGENRELRLQLTKERRARLELVDIVDSIRREQEPRRDV
ncbi:hypothetical protein Tco_1333045 [Tanacetum coccineum]